jgi:hypothetical protein
MTKRINAYYEDIHVSGTVSISPYGEWEVSDVEVHSGKVSMGEAEEMLCAQLEQQIELNYSDIL